MGEVMSLELRVKRENAQHSLHVKFGHGRRAGCNHAVLYNWYRYRGTTTNTVPVSFTLANRCAHAYQPLEEASRSLHRRSLDSASRTFSRCAHDVIELFFDMW